MAPMTRKPLLPLLVPVLALAACGGGSSSEADGGSPPPASDTNPPFTEASPRGGLYSEAQVVTLQASEPSTVYYTTDGNPPSVGGATTIAAPSPVRGLHLANPTTLRFFAVDGAGNQELPKTEIYAFDLEPPDLFLQSPPPGTPVDLGFLDVLPVTFQVDEAARVRLEVGGDGTPGDGLLVAEDELEANVIATLDLPGYFLPPGAVGPGVAVFLHAIDAAGGSSTYEFEVRTPAADSALLPGRVDWMALASDGRRAVLLDATAQLLRVVDTDPASPTLHEVTAAYSVGPAPTRVALTDDGARALVCVDEAVLEVDLDAGTTTVLPMQGRRTPSGLAVIAGERAVLAGSDGTFFSLDLDRAAPGFGTYTQIVAFQNQMTRGDFLVGADRRRALCVWEGGGEFGVRLLHTDPADPATFLESFPTVVAPSTAPASLGLGALSADSTRAWCPDPVGRLARADVSTGSPSIVATSPTLVLSGVTPTPDGEALLLTGGALTGIRVVDAESLVERIFLPAGGAPGGTTSEQVLLTPDGQRLYLVRGNGAPGGAELWVLRATAP
jgi:hypothetical protein